MKTCWKCQTIKPKSEFSKNNSRKDRLHTSCKKCHKIYWKEYYLKNKKKCIKQSKIKREELKKWWKEYKKQFKCSRCPENHPACIHFHHIKNNKILNVSTLVFRASKKKVFKEIKKCIPLCANCHAKEHWKN